MTPRPTPDGEGEHFVQPDLFPVEGEPESGGLPTGVNQGTGSEDTQVPASPMDQDPYREQEKRHQRGLNIRDGEDLGFEQTKIPGSYSSRRMPIRTLAPGEAPQVGDTRTPGSRAVHRVVRLREMPSRERPQRGPDGRTFDEADRAALADVSPEDRARSLGHLRGIIDDHQRARSERDAEPVTGSLAGEKEVPRPIDNPFRRVINTESVGVDPMDFEFVEPEDREHASPEFVSKFLSGLYKSGGYVFDRLSINENEHRTIIRSMFGFQKSVREDIELRCIAEGVDPAEVKGEIDKEVEETMLQKIENMRVFAEKLTVEADTLGKLRGLIDKPVLPGSGYEQMDDQAMLRLVSFAVDKFKNMVAVAGARSGLKNEQILAAIRALEAGLLTGPEEDKLDYWRQMTDIAKNYSEQRVNMFRGRIRAAYKFLSTS